MEDTAERDAVIYERAKAGYPHSYIGREFGLTRQRVHQIVRAYEDRINRVSGVEFVPDWQRQVWVRAIETANARIAGIDSESEQKAAGQ